jgi:hypothetical protein
MLSAALYQMNTHTERSRILGRPATLDDIPGPTWNAGAAWGSTGSGGMVGRSRTTSGAASPRQASHIRSQSWDLDVLFWDNARALALHERSNRQGRGR